VGADLRYFTNQDTDIHPRVEQWSNGANQTDELLRLLKVRRAALNKLGEHTIRAGKPTVLIEEPLVPIYMYHRYAVESASSMLGGQEFTYAMRGDNTTPMEWANGECNARRSTPVAHAQTVGADDSAAHPRSDPAAAARLRHASRAVPADDGRRFDPVNPASIAAEVTIGFVLQPIAPPHGGAVCGRSVAAGLGEVIDKLTKATFDQVTSGNYEAEVRRAEERVLVDRVMWLRERQRRTPGAPPSRRSSCRSSPRALRAEVGRTNRSGTAHADRRRHQALPERADARISKGDSRVTGAAGRADRRHGHKTWLRVAYLVAVWDGKFALRPGSKSPAQ
jgi:hypothetical protein